MGGGRWEVRGRRCENANIGVLAGGAPPPQTPPQAGRCRTSMGLRGDLSEIRQISAKNCQNHDFCVEVGGRRWEVGGRRWEVGGRR